MEKKHQDKVVVITGSSRGIGLGIARHLAQEGARIAVMGRNYDTAKAAADSLPTDCLAVRCDVSVEQDTIDMAKAVMDKYGRVDALVNNAGIFPVKLFEEMTLADWNAVMDIDLTGMFLATKAIYPFMAAQKSGKIVNAAHRSPGRRSGIHPLFRCKRRGDRLHQGPGAGMRPDEHPGERHRPPASSKPKWPRRTSRLFAEGTTRATPAGRLGTVEDLNGVISFLCSEKAAPISRPIIAVDGGYTMI